MKYVSLYRHTKQHSKFQRHDLETDFLHIWAPPPLRELQSLTCKMLCKIRASSCHTMIRQISFETWRASGTEPAWHAECSWAPSCDALTSNLPKNTYLTLTRQSSKPWRVLGPQMYGNHSMLGSCWRFWALVLRTVGVLVYLYFFWGSKQPKVGPVYKHWAPK